MAYDYKTEVAKLMNPQGFDKIMRALGAAKKLIDISGAARWSNIIQEAKIGGDTFMQCAIIDYLVEEKYLYKPGNQTMLMTQYQVYAGGDRFINV